MYSKIGDSNRRVRWSIGTRLTILYTLSAFAILMAAAVYLHWRLVVNLHREDGQFLADKVELLRTILRSNEKGTDSLQEEVEWETAALHFAKYYARIVDQNGHVVIQTPGMEKLIPVTDFSRPEAGVPLDLQVKSSDLDGNQRFLLLAAEAGKKGEAAGKIIQVALDISPEEAFLQSYRRSLAWAVFIGVLLFAGAGVLVARRGMRPLKELARTTDRIRASRLDQRLTVDAWPKELAALADGFDRMLDRLEDSFKRLSEFSSYLAHELRTPINNLRGEAGVALSQPRSVEEYRQTLESSLEEYARLTRLIDDLLFLARAESPTTHISRERFDAKTAAAEVCDYFEPLADDRQVKVRVEGNGTVFADPLLFRQAVSNLVSNALNHTAPKGEVVVNTRQETDGSLVLTVSDNGEGIPPDDLPRIFDRLYRGEQSRSGHVNGAGLGLAIVKSIINLHRGSVDVWSEPGNGTRFTLRFPAQITG